MANLPERPEYAEGIYQIELTDPVVGGVEGISNRQARQLAGRTGWLRQAIERILSGAQVVARASQLERARRFIFRGAATGEASFDGSSNAVVELTLANSGAKAGTYPVVSIDAKGLVTAGRALRPDDIPALPWSRITSGKPTSLAGYGITDALPASAFNWLNLPGKPTTFLPERHGHAWSEIAATPTTLAGYGITDALRANALTWANLTGKPGAFPPSSHTHPWSAISGTPGTLAGYGITEVPELVRTLGWRTRSAATANEAGGDFNPITRPGCHDILMHGANRNGPGGGYYYVLVFEYAGTNLTQLLVPYSTGGLIYRHRYNNVWGNYSHLLDSNNQHLHAGAPGQVAAFAGAAPPPGWLKANGAAVSRTHYARLFAAIGTRYGAGDGKTTFNLPDLRGEFIRGWDDARGLDASRTLGSVQAAMLSSHGHGASAASAGAHTHSISGSTAAANTAYLSRVRQLHGGATSSIGVPVSGESSNGVTVDAHSISGAFALRFTNSPTAHAHAISGTAASAGAHTHAITVQPAGGHETRPRNLALLHCIKY